MKTTELRPRVADLSLELYDRPIHPELIDSSACRTVRRDGYILTVHITPTGHTIRWQTKTLDLMEVTSNSDLETPRKRALFQHRIQGENTGRVSLGAGMCYQTSFQAEILPQEVFLHVHDEILRDGSKRGLLHNFQPNHRLSMAPLGFVTVETWAECLLFSSFHTFPLESTVIKTQSLIERTR